MSKSDQMKQNEKGLELMRKKLSSETQEKEKTQQELLAAKNCLVQLAQENVDLHDQIQTQLGGRLESLQNLHFIKGKCALTQ